MIKQWHKHVVLFRRRISIMFAGRSLKRTLLKINPYVSAFPTPDANSIRLLRELPQLK